MEDMNNGFDDVDEYEEQIESLILENGMLTHALINVLVKKGLIAREDIDEEVNRLYDEADAMDEDGEEE